MEEENEKLIALEDRIEGLEAQFDYLEDMVRNLDSMLSVEKMMPTLERYGKWEQKQREQQKLSNQTPTVKGE